MGGSTGRGVSGPEAVRPDVKETDPLRASAVRPSAARTEASSATRGQAARVDGYLKGSGATLDLGRSEGGSPRGAILYFDPAPAVIVNVEGQVAFSERSGIDYVVSSLLAAGGHLTTGRFLSGNAFGPGITVSMRGKRTLISTAARSTVWLLREGDAPKALGKEPIELRANDLLVEGALTPRLGQNIEKNFADPAKYRAYRIEDAAGGLSVYEFHFAKNIEGAADPSWSVERYFSWRLGHSPDYKLNIAYASSLSILKQAAARLGLGDRQVKQLVNIAVGDALLGWENNLTHALSHITWKLESYARAMEQIDWTPAEHERFKSGLVTERRDLTKHATFLSGFIDLIEKSLVEHGRLGLMFPYLGLAVSHLIKPAGFLREQAEALIFDLAKIDPSLESIDSLNKLIYRLQAVAKSVVGEQPIEESGESSALFAEVLGLPPERLSKILTQLLQRSKIEKREAVETEIDRIYQSLAQAFQVSMVLHKESSAETNRAIDSFLNETPLDYRRLEAYVSMSEVQRADFLRALKLSVKALSLIPFSDKIIPEFADHLFQEFSENGNRWP